MNLAETIARVQSVAPGVTGFTIPDPANVATWTFFGTLTAAERVNAIAIVQRDLSGAASSAAFWPAPVTAVERDIAALKKTVGVA